MKPRPCVFFDRDGVVNPPTDGYITSPEAFCLQSGIAEVLRLVESRGYARVLITNQQGVGKGLMSPSDLDNVHARMNDLLAEEGATFDAIYAAVGLAGEDEERKPSPAMLLRAARECRLDLSRSWMIGDDDKDIAAGRRAGVGTIRLVGSKPKNLPSDQEVTTLSDLFSLLETLLIHEKQRMMPAKQTVAVLGASDKPERYSNQAVRLLLEHGHDVIPVHPTLTAIDGLAVTPDLESISKPVDTLTLYLAPERLATMTNFIVNLNPGRVLFNPGSESPPLQAALKAASIPYEEACTLVLLRTGQFERF